MIGTTHHIAFGDPGVEKTLRFMRKIVLDSAKNARVVEWAQGVVRYTQERDPDAMAQAFLNWVRANVRYTEDPLEVESVKTPEAMLIELQRHGRITGDCVADAPIVVRHAERDPDGTVLIGTAIDTATFLRLSELAPDTEGRIDHDGLEILNHDGRWVPLRAALNKGKKKTLWVTTRSGGSVLLTPDHRVRSNGQWVRAMDLKVGDAVDSIDAAASVAESAAAIDPEHAWLLGLVCADATMGSYVASPRNGVRPPGPRFAWRLSNNDVGLLLRAKAILEKYYPENRFEIQQYDSERPGAPTRYHTDKHISHLIVKSGDVVGSRNAFIRKMIMACAPNGEQIIPAVVWGDREVMLAWLDGYGAGDGNHGESVYRYKITLGKPLIASAMSCFLRRLGLPHAFAAEGKKKDGSNRKAVRVVVYKDDLAGPRRNPPSDEVVSIIDAGEHVVYDLVADGEFVAGSLKVHNCDDQVVMLAAGLNAVGVDTEFIVVAADASSDDYSHVLLQYQSRGGEFITMDPIVRGSGPGWFPPRHSRVGYYRGNRLTNNRGGGSGFGILALAVFGYCILKAGR